MVVQTGRRTLVSAVERKTPSANEVREGKEKSPVSFELFVKAFDPIVVSFPQTRGWKLVRPQTSEKASYSTTERSGERMASVIR